MTDRKDTKEADLKEFENRVQENLSKLSPSVLERLNYVFSEPKAPKEMRTEYRKYIQWSRLPRVVLYTGYMGNGKTTCAVRQLVEEKDSRQIVSNAHLYHIPYTYQPATAGKLISVTNSRVLLDSAYDLADSRRHFAKGNALVSYWFSNVRKFNNRVILTMSEPGVLDRRIRQQVGAVFDPEFFFNKYKTPKVTLRRLYYNRKGKISKMVVYPTVNARKYFKYFNTFELPGAESILPKAEDK